MEKINVIDNPTRLAKCIEWYGTLEVLFKMSEYTKFREGAFLISKAEDPKNTMFNTRYLCLNCVRDFRYLIEHGLHLLDGRWYNLYYSVAEFNKKFPFWQFDSDRKEKLLDWVKNEMCPSVEGYDLFIDVDCDNNTFEAGKITIRHIMVVLDLYNINYELRSSGKGFHILCSHRQFTKLGFNFSEDYADNKNACNYFYNVAESLRKEFSDLIDIAVYDLRRVTKVPYSLVHYTEEIRVCFPFESLQEFEDFKYEDGQVDNFILKLSEQGNWRSLLRKRQTFIFNEHKITDVESFMRQWGKWED